MRRGGTLGFSAACKRQGRCQPRRFLLLQIRPKESSFGGDGGAIPEARPTKRLTLGHDGVGANSVDRDDFQICALLGGECVSPAASDPKDPRRRPDIGLFNLARNGRARQGEWVVADSVCCELVSTKFQQGNLQGILPHGGPRHPAKSCRNPSAIGVFETMPRFGRRG